MKKVIIFIGIMTILCTFTACSSEKIQGVAVSESGELQSITFEITEEKNIEDVLGCGIGKENIMYVTSMAGDGLKDYSIYWYEVDNGGIISKRGNIYRYGPGAKTEYQKITNNFTPPVWVMLYELPSQENLFNPTDVEKLQEKYGIKLSF